MATAMDPFSMFMLITGPAFLKDDESVINAVVKNSYLLPRFMDGKDMDLLLQGGTKIQDVIYLNEDSDAEFYKSNEQDFTVRNQQVGTSWEANWRLLKNSTSWTDLEIGLNGGDSSTMGGIGAFHRYKRIQKLKHMNLWTTQIHKMEDALTSTPSFAEMETGDGKFPYSLGCFITGPNSAGNVGVPNTAAGAWTTVEQIQGFVATAAPAAGTAASKWRNQSATFAGGDMTAGQERFWTGMRELHHKCKFERLPRFGSYSEPSRSPSFYAVSLWGLALAEMCMRSEQDAYLAGRQDPAWPAPMFNGVPFVFVPALGTSVMYNNQNGTAVLGSETTSNVAGPRVLAVNGKVLNMIMHKDRVMYRTPPAHPDRQPFTTVMFTDTWYNVVCQNRRELGILTPTTAVTTPAAPSAGI